MFKLVFECALKHLLLLLPPSSNLSNDELVMLSKYFKGVLQKDMASQYAEN